MGGMDKPRGGNGLIVRQVRLKKRFLDALAQCGIATEAALCAGVPINTVYHSWREKDQAFVEAMDLARDHGEEQMRLEGAQEVKRRAFNGNDGMLYFHMKRYEPRYKDSFNVNVGVVGPASVSIEIDGGQSAIPEQTGDKQR